MKFIEKDIQDCLHSILKGEGLFTAKLHEFIGMFWHSELRLLTLIRCNERIPAYLSGIAWLLKGRNRLILLHVHSTLDVCDFCRLQLSGSVYNWMHEKIIKFFHIDSEKTTFPIFHVVSWDKQPRRKIGFKKFVDSQELMIDQLASIEDTKLPFTENTKPFISFVHVGSHESSAENRTKM